MKRILAHFVFPSGGRIGLLTRIYFAWKGRRNLRAESRLPDPGDFPVDFVVTWVDGNDPVWQAKKRQYEGSLDSDTKKGNSAARYRDWNMFPYWFRAVEKYAPWVRYVFLVTDGQVPAWLDTGHPKLKLVTHRDYIPEQYLPVFNTNSIELNLWRIEELSEHFVYFNDDFFLSSPTRKEDFFFKGLPRLHAVAKPIRAYRTMSTFEHHLFNNVGLFNSAFPVRNAIATHPEKWFAGCYGASRELNRVAYRLNYLPGMFFSHLCNPYRKSSMKACAEEFSAAFDNTSSHRFRTYTDISNQVFDLWEVLHGSFAPVGKSHFGFMKNIKRDTIDLLEENLLRKKNLCVCLNDSDNFPPEDFPYLKERVLAAFEQKLPDRSGFEKPPEGD
ncbi:MAG: Stealth CR1 domain-containing protein [Oscillospiraceae bacterium]|nr:Stealth CR1 domain-containing protein [Oscillospiraceae bacterium]